MTQYKELYTGTDDMLQYLFILSNHITLQQEIQYM